MNEQPPNQPEREQSEQAMPRVWIGSLADYNAGRLHGEWVDAGVDAETLHDAVRDILKASPEPGAEEFGIFDYDNFGAYRPGEYEPLDQVAAVARGIVECGPAFAAWADLDEGGEGLLESFHDCYLGEYDSPEDWAQETLDSSDLGEQVDRAVPESLRPYVQIDYAAFARDCRLSGDVVFVDRSGGVWVFRNR